MTDPTSLRVRDVTLDDLDAVLTLRARSFGPLGSPGSWWEQVARETLGGRWLCAEEPGGGIVAAGRVMPFTQAWGGRAVQMGGVAGVYSEPRARGRGAVTRLMAGLIDRMGELGDCVSCLYPTVPGAYRRSGYELAGERTRLSFTASDFRGLARTPVTVRDATCADAAHIETLVRDHHARLGTSGALLPTAQQWQQDIEDDDVVTYVAVTDAGEPCGLVAYGIEKESLHVHDLVAADASVAAQLWSVVGSGASACPVLHTWLDPRDPAMLGAPVSFAIESQSWRWMARVIDLPAAVSARGYAPALTATARVTVSDAEAPRNNGTWVLTVHDGIGHAERDCGATDLGVEVEPRGLAALWSGWGTAAVAAAGLATGGTPAERAALDSVLACRPYLSTYF